MMNRNCIVELTKTKTSTYACHVIAENRDMFDESELLEEVEQI